MQRVKAMEDVNEILAEQQRELERIRRKRNRKMDTSAVRQVLNIIFLILALIGIVLYFSFPDKHVMGMAVIAVGMLVKIAEFFIRFMF